MLFSCEPELRQELFCFAWRVEYWIPLRQFIKSLNPVGFQYDTAITTNWVKEYVFPQIHCNLIFFLHSKDLSSCLSIILAAHFFSPSPFLSSLGTFKAPGLD